MFRSLLAVIFLFVASPTFAQKILYSIADNESLSSGVITWQAITGSGGGDGVTSLEARASYPHRIATTFSCLGINIVSNTFTGANSSTLTLMLDTDGTGGSAPAATALTITIPAGATGIHKNCSDEVAIDADDMIHTKLVAGTESGKTIAYRTMWIVSEPTTTYGYHLGAFANWNIAEGARFAGPIGIADDSTVEASESLRMTGSGTITAIQAHNMTAQADGTVTVTLRIAGSDGNKALTVGAGAAEANYVSTAGTDTYADNNAITLSHAETGTGSTAWSWWQMVVVPDVEKFEMGAGRINTLAAAGATEYYAIGDLSNACTTEADCQTEAQFPMTVSDLRAYARVNTVSADSSCSFRVNGSNALTTTITASTTGWFDPAATSTAVETGDLINFACTPGATGTTLEVNKILVTVEDATPSDVPGVITAVADQYCSVGPQFDTAATCTLPENTTAGNFLACTLGWESSGVTLTGLTHGGVAATTILNTASSRSVMLAYWANIAGGAATIVPDLNSGATNMYISCGEYAGVLATSPLDQSGNTTDLVSTQDIVHNSISPTEDATLVLAAFQSVGTEVVGVPPACGTRIGSQNRHFMFFCIQTAAEDTTMGWTATTIADGPTVIGNFKVANIEAPEESAGTGNGRFQILFVN